MTLSLPGAHTLEIQRTPDARPPDHDGRPCLVAQTSAVWVRLDGGAWTPSLYRSTQAVFHRWLDLPASGIPAAWEETTGETLGRRVCEGCGERKPDVRAVEGSDEVWCGGCWS